MKVNIKFKGFLQNVDRDFPSLKDAETWLRKIGRWNDYSVKITQKEVES